MNIFNIARRSKTLIACLLMMTIGNVWAAKQIVNETMDAAAVSNIEIEHLAGKANIIGWDKNQVKVEGELGEKTEEFKFERKGNSIQIIVKTQRSRYWNNNWDKDDADDITIHVPYMSRVEYTTTNTDVSITNILGGLKAEVVNGDMSVNKVAGRVRLESVNGDIIAKNIEGELTIETVNGDVNANHKQAIDLELSTVNGDIEAYSDSPDIKAETVNGDIELVLSKVDELELSTVNGSIQVSMDLNKGGDVRASSVGGQIELAFQKDVAAKFDIEAHAGGSIKNKLSDDKVNKGKYGPRRWLEFSTPNADGNVEVSTVHGRVRLDTK